MNGINQTANRLWPAFLLTMVLCISGISCAGLAPAKDLDEASVLLTDAAVRSDLDGVLQAKEKLQQMVEHPVVTNDNTMEAGVRYQIAFANFQTMYITFGQMPDGKKRMEESLEHLDKAVRLQPEFADAYVLSALCAYYLSTIDHEYEDGQSRISFFLEKARSQAPDRPSLATAEAFMSFRGSPNEVQRKIQRALDIAERDVREARKITWWHVIPYHYKAMNYYFQGELLKAREPVERVLSLRPDLEVVQSTLVPALQPKHSINPTMYTHLEWIPLAEDKEGDGQNPELADGRALSYHYDPGSDYLWFKFDYYKLPDSTSFGVNIAVDIDGNQENGAKWWGGDSVFHFDRLITVWVRKADDKNYYGTVGISDDVSVRRMRLVQLAWNNIRFGADASKKQVLIGLERSELSTAPVIQLVAAVGSDLVWNDNIQDTGSSTITFSGGTQ